MLEEAKPEYGFKDVTAENIAEPDPVVLAFVNIERGVTRSQTPADYVDYVAGLHLTEPVPLEVRRAFYFARNVMCYGYYYWPALTVAAQQLLRVADFAAEAAARGYGLKPQLNFKDRILRLVEIGAILPGRASAWGEIRELRNRATHPEFQQTWGPSLALNASRLVAEEIQAIRWDLGATSTQPLENT